MQEAKTLVRLCIYAGSSEPLLFANPTSTKILCAGPYKDLEHKYCSSNVHHSTLAFQSEYFSLDTNNQLDICLFVLVLYVPVSNFSVMLGRFPVFLG